MLLYVPRPLMSMTQNLCIFYRLQSFRTLEWFCRKEKPVSFRALLQNCGENNLDRRRRKRSGRGCMLHLPVWKTRAAFAATHVAASRPERTRTPRATPPTRFCNRASLRMPLPSQEEYGKRLRRICRPARSTFPLTGKDSSRKAMPGERKDCGHGLLT